MTRQKIVTAAVLLLAACGVASGAQPGYTYLDLAHENISVDVEEGSLHRLDAVGISASWQVINHLAVGAEARRVREDGFAIGTTRYKAFGNFLVRATTFWSLFGVVDSYVAINYDVTAKQPGGELGLRSRPFSAVEFHVALNVDGMPRSRDRRTGAGNLEFGVAVHPTRNLAVGFDHGRTVLGDDIGRVNRVFLRYEFARD